MLPRWDQLASCNVVVRSHDANGNVISKSHTYPILNTRVTELMTDIIAESIFAQCNSDRNVYLLLEALVDYQKDNKAFSLSNQQITV